MASRLHDITPGENDLGEGVSLVKRGANRRRFLLAKSETVEFDETVAKALDEPAEGEDAVLDAVRKAGADEDTVNLAAAYARIVEAIPADVLKAMTPQQMDAEDETDDGDGPESGDGSTDDDELAKAYETVIKRTFTADDRKKLAASGAALPDGSYPIENTSDLHNAIHAVGRGKAPHAEIRAHIKARAKALGAEDQLPDDWKVNKEDDMSETAQAVPVKKDDGSWDLTGVPEEQRPAFEAVFKAQEDELAELRKEAEAEASKAENAERIAKAVEEKLAKAEYVAKAEGYDNLAKSADELGELLYDIAKAETDENLPAGTSEKLTELLKAANEAAKDVFKEAGRVGGNGKGDAETRLEAAAVEIRKADPSLTKEQAFVKALDNDKTLYVEMKEQN